MNFVIISRDPHLVNILTDIKFFTSALFYAASLPYLNAFEETLH